VLIEVNLGQNRCGVLPEDAVALAQALTAQRQLRLVGVQGYEGHLQHVRSLAERKQRSQAALERLTATVQALRGAGFAVPHVTTGGTGTYAFCARHPLVSEVQPGSFMFMDADYGDDEGLPFAQALVVTATVISAPRPGEVVVDAGLKSLSTDSGPARLAEVVGWSYRPGGDEHGILTRTADNAPPLAVGDRVAFVPSHIDTTVNLHDQYVVAQGGHVIDVWPLAARGKVQ
jgi:D-serine deaminase-like pyridoxal phosphate-dependent protein